MTTIRWTNFQCWPTNVVFTDTTPVAIEPIIVEPLPTGWPTKFERAAERLRHEYEHGYVPPTPMAPKKCTCGSDKVGSPRHSSWCDKEGR